MFMYVNNINKNGATAGRSRSSVITIPQRLRA